MNLSQVASEFGIARETARNRLSASGVEPTEMRGGHPCYRLRDVIGALKGDEENDPDRLKPWERKAHYQAEHVKLQLQIQRGELVPSIEVEQSQAAMFKTLVQWVETLPDILERDVGLGPLPLAKTEEHLDKAREALYLLVNSGDDDADGAVQERA